MKSEAGELGEVKDVRVVAALAPGGPDEVAPPGVDIASVSSALGPATSAFDSPSEQFLALVPRDFAREHLVLSAGREGDVERLLVSERSNPAAGHNVGTRLGVSVIPEVVDGEALARAIDAAYTAAAGRAEASAGAAGDAAGANDDEDSIERLLAQADRDLLATQGKGPIVKLVDALLFEALGRSASDVHIQPLADRTLVRERVDGALRTTRELPVSLARPLVSRIKVMGKMDIAERRVPQDGRATVTIGRPGGDASTARAIDLRISTLPTAHGERAVIRLLESGAANVLGDFEALGMPDDVRSRYLASASRSSGIVLATGPTGSGKTTTLYTTLRWIATRSAADLNVMTVEDPIEYELSAAGVAISQAQVNTKKGVTFASGLRHILRQDPDVIMVGEIRDAETARIAIQASLTGHLVFSTLHTNDAPTAVTRLIDLGVEPYLVGASLAAALAQRLVRRVHAPCRGHGCEQCLQTGFRGRIGLFELLVVDEPMREAIGRGGTSATAGALRAMGRARGMRTLREEGDRLVRAGVTTEVEVLRVAGEAEEEVMGREAEAPPEPVTPEADRLEGRS